MKLSARLQVFTAAPTGKSAQRHSLSVRILGLRRQKKQVNTQIRILNVQLKSLRAQKKNISTQIDTIHQQLDGM